LTELYDLRLGSEADIRSIGALRVISTVEAKACAEADCATPIEYGPGPRNLTSLSSMGCPSLSGRGTLAHGEPQDALVCSRVGNIAKRLLAATGRHMIWFEIWQAEGRRLRPAHFPQGGFSGTGLSLTYVLNVGHRMKTTVRLA
jgi:hypothetical protein